MLLRPRRLVNALRRLAPILCCSGLASCSTAPKEAGPMCSGVQSAQEPALEAFVGDFKTGPDYLQVWDGKRYVSTFLKGVNLGRGVPSAFPGDFAIKLADYLRWFDKMGEMGVNLIRVYSLHPPAFFDALAAHNCANPTKTIYLMQGVGLPRDPDMTSAETLDLHASTAEFEQMIDEAIDCIHGRRSIPKRKMRAYGEFTTDVSHWTIGLLVGREVLADEVLATDARHAEETSFEGSALRLAAGNPTSVWVTARLDHAVATEQAKYGVSRPVAFSNWLETDPLRHRTEGSKWKKDVATIDTSQIVAHAAPSGVYASFHVYPYYPDFMSEDPGYQAYAKDAYGTDSYRGYLHELKAYHGKLPVIVAEFGVPSSWGLAHYSSNGMHHGGHSEAMQAAYTKRMVGDIYQEKLGGAVYFAWMDEWFKTCWITNDLAFPNDHFPKWHDITNPQQAYGLLAFDLGPPSYEAFPRTTGPGRVRAVETYADAEFFWVRLSLSSPLADGESFTMGYDTYRDDLGETLLPDGTRTKRRSEFALSVTAPSTAALRVMKAYDLYGFGVKMPYSRLKSVKSDTGAWVDVKRSTSNPHGSDDGVFQFPGTDQPLGELVARRSTTPASSRDSVVIDGSTVEVRIPWTMLHIADPTTFSVIHDDPATVAHESEVTEGIAVSVALGGEVLETNRHLWPTWRGAPKFTERYKPTAQALAESFAAVPSPLP